MKLGLGLATLAAGLTISSAAGATVYIVDALANSANSGSGTGLDTLLLDAGDLFTVSVDGDDLWSAGALPRWSDANGLTGDRVATGTDESGEAAGTLIGQNFGLFDIGGFSAPYGALVGQIGTGAGSYRLLGTSFSGAAWASGTLKLYYWDSFTGDNAGSIAANVALVPEPATWALMVGGFGLAGAALRTRRRRLAAA